MFFEGERIKAMREMIIADNTDARKKALAKIMPYQQGDFEALFEEMNGYPVTIRFLDPPLHEFLPTKEEDIAEIAKELNVTVEKVHEVIESLHEFNPMMGHRGCRLTVTYPEIAEMQTTAVINAAINVQKKGVNVIPQIMIPLVGEVKEFDFVKKIVVEMCIRDRHRVPAVSIMSSTRMTFLPSTLPMMVITSQTLAFWRRLSTIARLHPMRAAKLRARVTEPRSGETTTYSSLFSPTRSFMNEESSGAPSRWSTGMLKKP